MTESLDICDYLNDHDGKPLGETAVDQVEVKKYVKHIGKWDGNCWAFLNMDAGAKGFMGKITSHRLGFLKKRLSELPEESELVSAYKAKIEVLNGTYSEKQIDECKSQLEEILTSANTVLATNPYICGSEYSLGDVLFTCLLFRLEGSQLSNRQSVSDYYKRIQERPSFKKTFHSFAIQKSKAILVVSALPSLIWSGLTGCY